jgi:hypothetical protein
MAIYHLKCRGAPPDILASGKAAVFCFSCPPRWDRSLRIRSCRSSFPHIGLRTLRRRHNLPLSFERKRRIQENMRDQGFRRISPSKRRFSSRRSQRWRPILLLVQTGSAATGLAARIPDRTSTGTRIPTRIPTTGTPTGAATGTPTGVTTGTSTRNTTGAPTGAPAGTSTGSPTRTSTGIPTRDSTRGPSRRRLRRLRSVARERTPVMRESGPTSKTAHHNVGLQGFQ